MVKGQRASFRMEKPFIRQDGSQAWGRLTVSPFRDDAAQLRYAIGMVEDITEQKKNEEDIRSYQEQLRSLASDLSLAEENEKRRLATELHDQVGQILALAQIKLGALRESASTTALAAPLEEIRRLLEQSIRFTRSLTFELSPPILYDLGFEAAVEWLADMMQEQQGLPIEINRNGYPPQPLNEEIRVLLFQAVRELLVNVVKHAKASRVQISMAKEGRFLKVTVSDDGVGLSPEVSQGFGLFSIRERLKYLGGQLELVSEPGQGAQVAMTVPLKY
jgi:signal transduction histidine kinase